MVKIFIGGIPLNSTELELVELVSPYGTVVTIKIVRDKKSGKSKGYAFLEMQDLQDAQNAVIELDSTKFKGKKITLNVVQENK